MRRPVGPVTHDCVKIVVVRSGAMIILGEFGVKHVNVGDVMVIAANTALVFEPEGCVTATTLYLDHDYVIDQVFWQHAAQFTDRLDASRFLDIRYSEPVEIVRLGQHPAGLLMPWLDELTTLTLDGLTSMRFYHAQSLLSAILDVLVPHLTVTEQRMAATPRSTVAPSTPRHRAFRPLRAEAREAAALLSGELSHRWSVPELAGRVHLSPSQLRRVFVAAFGKPPITYLTMLRAERMAHLLRDTDSPISVIAAEVGWSDPDFAARQFRRSVGISPSEYRRIGRQDRLDEPPE